jgi:hypothetical protein
LLHGSAARLADTQGYGRHLQKSEPKGFFDLPSTMSSLPSPRRIGRERLINKLTNAMSDFEATASFSCGVYIGINRYGGTTRYGDFTSTKKTCCHPQPLISVGTHQMVMCQGKSLSLGGSSSVPSFLQGSRCCISNPRDFDANFNRDPRPQNCFRSSGVGPKEPLA